MKNIGIAIIALCIFNAHIAYSFPQGTPDKPELNGETPAVVKQMTTESVMKVPSEAPPQQPAAETTEESKQDGGEITEIQKDPEPVVETSPAPEQKNDESEAKENNAGEEVKTEKDQEKDQEITKVENKLNDDDTTTTSTTPTTTSTSKDDTTTSTTTTTTTPAPDTTTTTTSTSSTTTTTTPVPTPSPVPSTTTAKPTPPDHDRSQFSVTAFIGGMVFAFGMMAIGFIAFKFYKARNERNYHTL